MVPRYTHDVSEDDTMEDIRSYSTLRRFNSDAPGAVGEDLRHLPPRLRYSRRIELELETDRSISVKVKDIEDGLLQSPEE